MSPKFILIASFLLLCIASSNSIIITISKKRKMTNEEEGRKIHVHKGKKIAVKVSRSPPAKGWICCND
ncbi:PREDICTED: uncharacterized protein LOC104765128 [Camelina sativa]|uniref:Uncharacterized protein LOC104765128 n=1 Tax=Camelina sativa TaxID=90675 RepID=A0ABM1RC40_CAMSA|nr:PREDICTED: uncharacterized protein LOC104765128 [Camelina sativa]